MSSRLPDSTILGGLPAISSNRTVARYDTSAEWAGVADFGEGAVRAGAAIQGAWDRVSAEETESRYSSFEFDELRRYDEAVQGVQPGQAKNFTDNYLRGYFERAKEFQGSVSPQFHGPVEQKLFGLEKRIWGDAIGFERGEVKRSSLNNLDSTFRSVILPFASQAAKLPTGDLRKGKLLAEAEAKAKKLIDDNLALTPIEKDELWNGATDDKGNWKPGVRENIQKAFLGSLPDEEQLYADPTRPVETLGNRMRQIESGGDVNAVNPNSSAVGADGFLEGTWLGIMEKYRPELTKGKSKAQILAMRTDEQLSGEMRDLYATENSEFLGSRGYAATPGNIYLAHFLGPAGAVQMLGADPNTPADEINPAAAKANPSVFYINGDPNQPVTAGEIAEWSGALMSGVRHEDWAGTLDAVPFEYKVASAKDASGRIADAEAGRAIAENKARTALIEDRKYLLEIGRYGEAELFADIESGNIIDGDAIRTLRERIQERTKDATLRAKDSGLINGGYVPNRYVEDDQKMVDRLDAGSPDLLGDVNDQDPSLEGRDERQPDANDAAAQLRWWADKGVLPTAKVDELKLGLRNADRDTRMRAYSIADGLYRYDQAMVEHYFTEDDLKRIDLYQEYADKLAPEQLDELLSPNVTPQVAEAREGLMKAGETIAQDVDVSDLLNAFDPEYGGFPGGIPFNTPEVSADPLIAQSLKSDYVSLYAYHYSLAGNEESAKTLAIKSLGRKWNVTNVGSPGPMLVPYPPENFYPTFNESHDWMDDQAQAYVDSIEPDADGWFLTPYEGTEAAVAQWNAGIKVAVPYRLMVMDKGSDIPRIVRDPATNLPKEFEFDYTGQLEFHRERAMPREPLSQKDEMKSFVDENAPDWLKGTLGIPQSGPPAGPGPTLQ